MKAWIKQIALCAAVAATTVGAQARLQEIKIDQAVNSPTLTVRYSKMAAAMVELRVNGRSVNTRTISEAGLSGETNFTIDDAVLKDGENQIEILIFDKAGKLLGTQKSTLKASKDQNSPVSIEGMRGGESVQGLIEIKLGVNRDFREMYVSFFIDDQWKALKNYPPYSYAWDTSRYPNGWHEIEAWVVDESNNTYKTRKVKIFVNNPGGRTERKGSVPVGTGVVPVAKTPVAKAPVAKTPVAKTPVAKAPVAKTPAAKAPVAVVPVVAATLSPVVATSAIGRPSGLKAAKIDAGIQTGQKAMVPTGKRVVAKVATKAPTTLPAVKTPTKTPVAPKVTPAVKTMPTVAMLSIGRGSRIPNIGNFTVMLAGKAVKFDVQPKVVDGVPLTPFRHLFEQAGGKVTWEHLKKIISANGLGKDIKITIGLDKAIVNKKWVNLELAAYIEGNRAIVPLSFIKDSLDVNIDFDPATKRVLITQAK